MIAYTMKYLKMNVDKAYDYVKRRRPEISPNLGFMGQLYDFQNQIHGSTTNQISASTIRKIQTPKIITPMVQTKLPIVSGNIMFYYIHRVALYKILLYFL